MKQMIIFILILTESCTAQLTVPNKENIGGPFENRDLFYLGIPDLIDHIDTSAAWSDATEKITVRGKVLKRDGRTPVPNVLLYYYQTDSDGYYMGNSIHGNIRGWVKSDDYGNYEIKTGKPGAYPNRSEPAHIHVSVLEADIGYPYYIDAFVFDNDKLLTTEIRRNMDNRGGSGVLRGIQNGDDWSAKHNIILGLNIPNHTDNEALEISGKSIGEDLESFTPRHIWGPDRGTNVCPICKYGKYQGFLFYVGSEMTSEDLAVWLEFFEGQCVKSEIPLHGFMILTDEKNTDHNVFKIAETLQLERLSICIGQELDFRRNEVKMEGENTILLFERSNVYDKFIDLKPTKENLNRVSHRIQKQQ